MIRKPSPAEEYVTIIDNQGRQRIQHVEWIVKDVRQEEVYITADGLTYAEDSLIAKEFYEMVDELKRVPDVLVTLQLVIRDHTSPDDTLIYYKRMRIQATGRQQLMAVVKMRAGVKFFYNMHPQESGRVKGYRESVPPEIWYLASSVKASDFGLKIR